MTRTIRYLDGDNGYVGNPNQPNIQYWFEGDWVLYDGNQPGATPMLVSGTEYTIPSAVPEGVAVGVRMTLTRWCGEYDDQDVYIPDSNYRCTGEAGFLSVGCADDPCPTFVPEPTLGMLLGVGLVTLALLGRRRRRG